MSFFFYRPTSSLRLIQNFLLCFVLLLFLKFSIFLYCVHRSFLIHNLLFPYFNFYLRSSYLFFFSFLLPSPFALFVYLFLLFLFYFHLNNCFLLYFFILFLVSFVYHFTHFKFFRPAFAGGISLRSKWQQVSSVLQVSSEYSNKSKQFIFPHPVFILHSVSLN